MKKILIKLTRIYTPFICTIMALVNGVLFMGGVTELPAIYLMATLTGNSILVDFICNCKHVFFRPSQ